MICARCGEVASEGVAFCKGCGTALGGALPHAEAGMSALVCNACGNANPPGTNFCCTCGARLIAAPAVAAPAVAPPSGPRRAKTGPRLVTVRRDGSDGAAFSLDRDQLDIGRSEGDLLFDDPYMAPRHARLSHAAGRYELAPLEARNGVYVQVREETEIGDGDHLLIGKQVLRFEVLGETEREPEPALEHGVVLFGTAVRPAWGRLRQLTSAGVTRDVYHLTRTDVILGREQGDIVFSDDEFLSRRHAQLQFRGGRTSLVDLGSSNGTFLRLRGKQRLSSGTLIRIGDELLRFEIG